MMNKIRIIIGDKEVKAELFDNNSANEIYNILPAKGGAHLWGEEIYFPIPLDIELEPDARDEVEVGDLAYWQPGKMFCIFFGPTPMSTGKKPVAASAVNVFGKIIGDLSPLYDVQSNDIIKVEIDNDGKN